MTVVDENLYNRQIYVLGADGMRVLANSDILISGLDGLGLEVAKNLVLGGVRSVTLHDQSPLSWNDLSTHFFASETDIGKPRAGVCRDKLAELNSLVSVHLLAKPQLSKDDMEKYTVVVLCQQLHSLCLEIGDICHANGIKLIVASTCGLFARLFCDFGDEFTILDATGREPPCTFVQDIEKSAEGLVTCVDEVRHEFSDGDCVTFSEVKGMTELNGCEPRKICVAGPGGFYIGDTTTLSEYISGGICRLVNLPQTHSYKSYRESFNQPKISDSDHGKLDRMRHLHIYFKALGSYLEKNKNLFPKPWNQKDALSFIDCVTEAHEELQDTDAKVDEIDKQLAALFSYICSGQCCPIQAVIGGFAAQEVMKACTGKFIPLNQWFYLDATECLPLSKSNNACKFDELVIAEDDASPKKTRYDGQVAIFGRLFQEKLNALKYFMVGSGAIGCELLKNFALIGVGAGPGGKVTVTDMDSIEKSNLNRQFLFRPWDIDKMKSAVAASAVKRINPEMNIVAQENRVGLETENFYDDAFFEGLDGVANALDNVETRLYVDRRCVYYRKPMLESGTLGTKGNVESVIPFLTESYSSRQGAPEKSFPACTLKHFPYLIEHTLQWARDLFEGQFALQSRSCDKFLHEPVEFLECTMREYGNQPLESLQTLKDNLVDKLPKSFEDCVSWARLLFQDLYSNTIAQLIFNFPLDSVTQCGLPFWSGTKRCPAPLKFDVTESIHMDFIISAANLRAFMYKIPENRDQCQITKMVEMVNVPPFEPKVGVKIDVTEEEAEASEKTPLVNKKLLDELHAYLTSYKNTDGIQVNLIDFEKDDDKNFHMDFITAASNLRAACYEIAPADRLTSKRIAGRIIPAIATTTSVVAGLVCLELIKLTQGHNDLTFYKNAFLNLRDPFIAFYEPVEPTKLKYNDIEYTLWDRFDVSGPMTLQQLIDYLKNEHRIVLNMMSYGVSIVHTFMSTPEESEKRLIMTLEALVEHVTKLPIPPNVSSLVFQLCCDNEDGEDMDVPPLRYTINKTK